MVANNASEKFKICLSVEGDKSPFWGQVRYDNNLIIEDGNSIETLQERMKKLLIDFHNLDPSTYIFEIEVI